MTYETSQDYERTSVNFSILVKQTRTLLSQIHNYNQQEVWNANVITRQAERLLMKARTRAQ